MHRSNSKNRLSMQLLEAAARLTSSARRTENWTHLFVFSRFEAHTVKSTDAVQSFLGLLLTAVAHVCMHVCGGWLACT
jgi:hypothetical protein